MADIADTLKNLLGDNADEKISSVMNMLSENNSSNSIETAPDGNIISQLQIFQVNTKIFRNKGLKVIKGFRQGIIDIDCNIHIEHPPDLPGFVGLLYHIKISISIMKPRESLCSYRYFNLERS